MNLFDLQRWSLYCLQGVLLGDIWGEERHSVIKAQNWEIWVIICSVVAFLCDLEQGAWNILLFWKIFIFKTSTLLFKRTKASGYSKCYVVTLLTHKTPTPPPFPNPKPNTTGFFYSFSPWRAICHRKKLVFCLVHQVNGKHRAPLPSVIHPASSSKAIMPCFNYLCTEKVSLYYQYFFTCFWSLIRLCGFNGLFLMTKRWAQLKILPTCKANEDFIKRTMLYSNPYLTLLSTHDT